MAGHKGELGMCGMPMINWRSLFWMHGLAVVNGESITPCGRKETSCRLRKACGPPGPCTNMFD